MLPRLGGNAFVDSLIECTHLGFVDCEVGLVLLKEVFIALRETWQLVNVLYRVIRSIACNDTSNLGVHTPELSVLALVNGFQIENGMRILPSW